MIQILPSYFSFDEKKLDEFISELGVVSEVQRKIFNMLIATKSAYLDYDDFFVRSEATSGIRNFESELLTLMRKMRSRFYGMVLTRRNTDGTKKNYAIVLLDDTDLVFFYYLLLDLFDNLYTEERTAFLTISALKKKGITLPPAILKEIEASQISDDFFSMNHQEKKVFVFSSLGDNFPVPALRLKIFIEFCILRVKYVLRDSNIKDWLSRALSLNIRNIGIMLQEEDLAALMNLCGAVRSDKEDFLSVSKITGKDDFFKALEIVEVYFKNQESDKREKADLERLFLMHMDELSVKLAQEEGFISADQLSKAISTAANTFNSPNDFKTRALERLKGHGYNAKYDIPILLDFKGSYLHKDGLFPLFKKEFLASQSKVKDHLVLLARNALEQSISTIFSSQVSVEKEIASNLADEAPFVHFMLSQPKLLTEYIFYYFRELQGVKSMEEIKNQVTLYAPQREPVVVPFIEIYRISLENIFKKAYASLSIFKQLWFYLSGRYSTYREKVMSIDSIRTEIKVLLTEDSEISTKPPATEKLRKTFQSRRGGRPRPAPEKREYTKSERDKVWRDFSNQIKD